MAGHIVLFGATGYAGRLTAEALLARGQRPVLAGRDRGRVEALATELGGLEARVADVSEPTSVRALVEAGDVLLSTVGPFARWGDPAIEAAIDAGAHYIDSTGEASFIRRVFEEFGPRAQRAQIGALTAMGYDFVPGNLAGALALRDAGEAATRVAIGYFITGASGAGGMSGGTRASALGATFDPAFAWRGGRIVAERSGKRVRSFPVRRRTKSGVSIGSTEHFALPRLHPGLREVDVYLGWFGPLSRGMQGLSAGAALAAKVPGARRLLDAAVRRIARGSTGGPDAAERGKSGSHIVAIASDEAGRALAEIHLDGINGYTYTAAMLAWVAEHIVVGALQGVGALGAVEAFGLDALERGNAEVGLKRA